jgi:predicted  nucleic acid-binding Zn-ribbon protein
MRRAAESDTSRARALKAMMNNTPERRKPDAFEHLVREPWMDMPLKSMTKSQREALREFNKKVAEVEESLKKAVRIAEGERKGLEEEVIAHINNFNAQLLHLYKECISHKMQIASAERARLALISSVIGVRTPTGLPVWCCF